MLDKARPVTPQLTGGRAARIGRLIENPTVTYRSHKNVFTLDNHLFEPHRSLLLRPNNHYGLNSGRIDHRGLRPRVFYSQGVRKRLEKLGLERSKVKQRNSRGASGGAPALMQ